MAGFTCFALGARESIAIAAVLGSLFAALAAIGGYFLFHERMLRHQIAGIGLIVLGVAGISATRV
jgi:drug/metabolite transporter (DMT)-like permease